MSLTCINKFIRRYYSILFIKKANLYLKTKMFYKLGFEVLTLCRSKYLIKNKFAEDIRIVHLKPITDIDQLMGH